MSGIKTPNHQANFNRAVQAAPHFKCSARDNFSSAQHFLDGRFRGGRQNRAADDAVAMLVPPDAARGKAASDFVISRARRSLSSGACACCAPKMSRCILGAPASRLVVARY